MTNHPNATASFVTSSAVGALVWALHRYAGVNLSVRQALALLGGANAIVLWVGRVGLKGAWLRIWHGATAVVNGAKGPAPAPPDPSA
jgi:hypothetical protein